MLHHPHDSPESLSQLGRVREGKEAAVQDVVPVVGDEGDAVAASNLHHAAHPLDRLLTPVPGEGDHLHRERDSHAEAVHQLPVVHHDDVPPAGQGHDLLAKKGPPSTLDQITLAVHFICPVDGQIDLGALFQGGQWNACLPSQPLAGNGSRNAADP